LLGCEKRRKKTTTVVILANVDNEAFFKFFSAFAAVLTVQENKIFSI
jgi:hypothetical protein